VIISRVNLAPLILCTFVRQLSMPVFSPRVVCRLLFVCTSDTIRVKSVEATVYSAEDQVALQLPYVDPNP
jgi:hypothetical protein